MVLIFQQLQYINELLKNIMLIFPQYCLGLGLMEMSRNQLYSDAFKKFGKYCCTNMKNERSIVISVKVRVSHGLSNLDIYVHVYWHLW